MLIKENYSEANFREIIKYKIEWILKTIRDYINYPFKLLKN
jgi:hypothetical protein